MNDKAPSKFVPGARVAVQFHARFNDNRWWRTGAVNKVLKNGNFTIAFDPPNDGHADNRSQWHVHRDGDGASGAGETRGHVHIVTPKIAKMVATQRRINSTAARLKKVQDVVAKLALKGNADEGAVLEMQGIVGAIERATGTNHERLLADLEQGDD